MTWLPTVRIPEEPGRYLVTVQCPSTSFVCEASFDGERWHIFNQNDNEFVKSGKARIVAFMHMPKPMIVMGATQS